MKPELYDEVHEIALDIVNASSYSDKKTQWGAYQRLSRLCEENEWLEGNHPFQWETLADFTTDRYLALGIYSKALNYALSEELPEYVGSICLAMAECQKELGNIAEASQMATKANEAAALTKDLELRRNISEFLLQLQKST